MWGRLWFVYVEIIFVIIFSAQNAYRAFAKRQMDFVSTPAN